MVSVRRVSTEKYVAAGFITAVIFLLGLFLGFVIEGKRVNLLQDIEDEQRVEFASSQLQYAYVQSLQARESCAGIYKVFYENLRRLDQTRYRLEKYVQDSRLNDATFELLKRDYTLEQLRYWMLSGQAREVCDEDVVRVLYFYSTDEECPRCGDQAFVLNYVKGLLQERALIFAIDARLAEPMVDVLERQHNITSYPSLVIERDVLSGFVSKEAILGEVCGKYERPPEGCAEK